MNKKGPAVASALICAVLVASALLFARNPASARGASFAVQESQSALDEQIRLLRKDLRSQRKQIIAQNMNLTEADAVKFWPVYDQYVSDLVASNGAKYELIKEYATADSMTDEQADPLAKRWLTVDQNVLQLRLQYLPKFRAVLTAKQTARFYQIDRRVQMMIDLQLASSLPLVGS